MKTPYISPETEALIVSVEMNFLYSTGGSSGTNLGNPSIVSGDYDDYFN